MANLFYAAFVPGFQDYIAELVKERLADAAIKKLLEGAILFETECTYDKLNFFCFNNIFAVIDVLENAAKDKALEAHIRKTLGKPSSIISENNSKIRSFRIIFSIENKPSAVNEAAKQEAENFISHASGLKIDRSNPDTEFWYLYRREGFSLFMKRLTRHASFEKSLHPGELSPQLAWLLCRLSNPKHTDTVIDPFCGYGSIPGQRIKYFPLKKFYAFDIDKAPLAFAKKKITAKQPCEIKQADIYSIFDVLPRGEADAIITDPPWGMFRETEIPLQKFYDDMVGIFSRLLKAGGLAVVLTAKQEEFRQAVDKTPAFSLIRTIPVLVSGKKAAVFVLENHFV
ncbi:methyltransferase [Leadbettera azotonutricia]|uniref:Putative RNA methylase family n=1 Tax=Leadbettera azotonutricia (strain ATCC BAA-888 / DSM 13862 / ZAS-9) TaxID=545695 RepID=F5YE33_LEAAZ|nr:methyltransferase [Leadbettera azotonutricia]AEF82378.1 putative RNA methylase family [Leadbettera azotonutricia ZAS-9]